MIRRTAQEFSVRHLLRSLEDNPERRALLANGTEISAGDLFTRVSLVRATLRASLSVGDVVAISGERSLDAIAVVLASWAEGMTPFPVDCRQETQMLCQVLDGVRPKGCFFGGALDVQAIQSRLHYLRWKAVSGRNAEGCLRTDVSSAASSSDNGEISDTSESVILHSAGVCAIPHTIRHGHASLTTQRCAVTSQFGLRRNDVVCFSGTLAASAPFSLVFLAALMEDACVSLDDPTKLTSPIMLQDSERLVVLLSEAHDCSLSAEQLLRLKGAKSVILSDAPANDERVNLIQRATDAKVFSAYCCAEACGFLCVNSSPGLWPADAAGVPVPGVQMAVLDAKSRLLHDSSVGRVAFRFSDANDEAWRLTGDWGHFDENGLLHIAGCERSIIWKGGFPVFAREVEDTLRSISGVKDSWIFGIPDREVGEEVTAQIAISDAGLSIDTLLTRAGELLPAYMLPHEPLFVQELPVTPSGKKIRRASRVTSSSGAVRPPQTPSARGPNLAAPIADIDHPAQD